MLAIILGCDAVHQPENHTSHTRARARHLFNPRQRALNAPDYLSRCEFQSIYSSFQVKIQMDAPNGVERRRMLSRCEQIPILSVSVILLSRWADTKYSALKFFNIRMVGFCDRHNHLYSSFCLDCNWVARLCIIRLPPCRPSKFTGCELNIRRALQCDHHRLFAVFCNMSG